MNYLEEYKKWCEDSSFDEETKKELISIKDNKEEIEDTYHLFMDTVFRDFKNLL